MNCGPVVRLLISLLLVLSACQTDEEIMPAPAPADTPAPAGPPLIPKAVKPALGKNSESFLFGSFSNLPYRILVPRNYDSTKSYPLHVFLHGIGERGTDNEKHLSLGASFFQADSIRTAYPAFIVFPQCPTTDFWFSEAILETLRALIDTLREFYTIDERKISIGGFSMGAYGTFALVANNPGFFEAAVAISGDGDEEQAPLMAKTKWRIFAGKKDDVVSSSKSEEMAIALTKAGAKVSFTLYPDADHGGTCLKAFAEPDFYQWLFSKSTRTLTHGATN